MRTFAASVALLLALLGIVFGAIRYMDYTENPRSSFATYADMEAAGMIAAGWLPDFLPRSAIQIQEGHNLDSNRVWAQFKYEVGDVESVEAACAKIAENDRGAKYLCPPVAKRTSTVTLGNDGFGHYLSYDDGI